jgi:hypothetical protein
MQFTLASGQVAYKNSLIGFTLGGTTCVVATATSGLFILGTAAEAVDASSAAKSITVDLGKERGMKWFANHTSGAVAATDVGALCYVQDDQTVTMLSTSRAVAGRVWAYSATKGVLVEILDIGAEYGSAAATLVAPRTGTLPTPGGTSDMAPSVGAIVNGYVYLLPSLATNSTLTLPTSTIADGTTITIVADGTQGAFTTTYRYGTTAITTALTASKAHRAAFTKYGNLWMATVTVAP